MYDEFRAFVQPLLEERRAKAVPPVKVPVRVTTERRDRRRMSRSSGRRSCWFKLRCNLPHCPYKHPEGWTEKQRQLRARSPPPRNPKGRQDRVVEVGPKAGRAKQSVPAKEQQQPVRVPKPSREAQPPLEQQAPKAQESETADEEIAELRRRAETAEQQAEKFRSAVMHTMTRLTSAQAEITALEKDKADLCADLAMMQGGETPSTTKGTVATATERAKKAEQCAADEKALRESLEKTFAEEQRKAAERLAEEQALRESLEKTLAQEKCIAVRIQSKVEKLERTIATMRTELSEKDKELEDEQEEHKMTQLQLVTTLTSAPDATGELKELRAQVRKEQSSREESVETARRESEKRAKAERELEACHRTLAQTREEAREKRVLLEKEVTDAHDNALTRCQEASDYTAKLEREGRTLRAQIDALRVENKALMDYRKGLEEQEREAATRNAELLGAQSRVGTAMQELKSQQTLMALREADLARRNELVERKAREVSEQLDSKEEALMGRVQGLVCALDELYAKAHADNSGIVEVQRELIQARETVELMRLDLVGQRHQLNAEHANVEATQALANAQMGMVTRLQQGLMAGYHHWQQQMQLMQGQGRETLQARFVALHNMAVTYAQQQATESLQLEERRTIVLAIQQERQYLIEQGAAPDAMAGLPAIEWRPGGNYLQLQQ